MISESRRHLQEAGETYAEHLGFAVTVGLMAIGAGLACIIHAIVPALCRQTCSATIKELYRLFEDRGELENVRNQSSGPMVFAGLMSLSAFASAPLIIAARGDWWSWAVAALSFTIPAVFLTTNPQLEPV